MNRYLIESAHLVVCINIAKMFSHFWIHGKLRENRHFRVFYENNKNKTLVLDVNNYKRISRTAVM